MKKADSHLNTMKSNIKFCKGNYISNEEKKQIKQLWEKSFDKKIEDDMELLDETIIGILVNNSKDVIAISFLLCPTETLKVNNETSYKNIIEQGVTENDIYLYNFCVADTERKKGYGKLLIQECHKHLKILNKQKILLFVEHGNIPAICLYNKLQYKVHRATPGGFIMEKNLQ